MATVATSSALKGWEEPLSLGLRSRTLRRSNSKSCRHSAIHDKDLAGDKGGLLGGQIQRQAGDLFGLSDAPQRRVGFIMAAAAFLLPEVLAEIGLNQAWGNGVDADVVRTKFLSPDPCHHEQTDRKSTRLNSSH